MVVGEEAAVHVRGKHVVLLGVLGPHGLLLDDVSFNGRMLHIATQHIASPAEDVQEPKDVHRQTNREFSVSIVYLEK